MSQNATPVHFEFPGLNRTQVTAAVVLKATSGQIHRILVQAPGTGGVLTINDVATVGGATAANQIATYTFTQLGAILGATGGKIEFEWPCLAGITVSAIPTGGGVVAISWS